MTYFYQFLEHRHANLAPLAKELETTMFVSPRMMLTHSRTLIEAIISDVLTIENVPYDKFSTMKDKIELLETKLDASQNVIHAFECIRKRGNLAAHETRPFRLSEALQSWEDLYTVTRWFIEVYSSPDIEIPLYVDPTPPENGAFGNEEIEARFAQLETLLTKALGDSSPEEAAATVDEITVTQPIPAFPGFTTIRSIKYENEKLDIPYFLRDVFLLPQRFPRSETFLIRLGGEQQARLMSELPTNLAGLHEWVKRFKPENDRYLFEELKVFIAEEIARRKVRLERAGELLFFYKDDYIVVTEELGKIELTKENFHDVTALLNQLEMHDVRKVKQLPSELVILGKYPKVGVATVEKLFEQLKEM